MVAQSGPLEDGRLVAILRSGADFPLTIFSQAVAGPKREPEFPRTPVGLPLGLGHSLCGSPFSSSEMHQNPKATPTRPAVVPSTVLPVMPPEM